MSLHLILGIYIVQRLKAVTSGLKLHQKRPLFRVDIFMTNRKDPLHLIIILKLSLLPFFPLVFVFLDCEAIRLQLAI